MFEYDVNHCEQVVNWASNTQALCRSVGASYEWETRTPVNFAGAQTKLLEMYQEAWSEEAGSKPKLALFCQIKDSLLPGVHLTANLLKDKRSHMSQLRCGTLPLQVELGRHQNILRAHRICRLCNIESETETHFLFRCCGNVNTQIKHYHLLKEILNFTTDAEKI